MSMKAYRQVRMDLNGRFNFWQMLLHTRAVTPPRVMGRLWRWWPAVLIVAIGSAAVHLSARAPSVQSAVDQPSLSAPPKQQHTPRIPDWR